MHDKVAYTTMDFWVHHHGRYRGKGSPDAIMVKSCWRTKNIFEDPDFEEITNQMEIYDEEEDEFDSSDEDDNYESGEKITTFVQKINC
ncbi:hypothetical protein EVAR_101520_1 [Eumeta japonica]|uniref:Uncharacterized protein n=1 Tax=Eumeta variegata TaxID=151549 RepID=A0A4C1TPZ5_EUMVA|nr:hypothetical protein EVAR_101520_1 [Eumeta japonica]